MSREQRTPDHDLGDRASAGRRLFGQPRWQRADDDLLCRQPVPPRERDAQQLERESPARARGRVGRDPEGQVRCDDERSRADQDGRAGAPRETVGERMIGQGAVGLDGTGDDLGHGVGGDQVDPFEGGHHGALRSAERRGRGRQPDVRSTPGGGIIRRLPEAAEGPLAAGRRGVGQVPAGGTTGAVPRLPFGHLETGIRHPVREFAPDRDLDPDEVDARRDQTGDFLEGGVDVGLTEGDPEPRTRGFAQHPDRLAPDGALGVDPFDGGRRQPRRLDLGDRPAIAFAQQLALEGQVDRARCHVQRELLRLEVVLEEGHREWQRDAGAQSARVRSQPTIDRRPGERPAGRIQPVDPEQAQDRPLLPDRRGRPGAGAP